MARRLLLMVSALLFVAGGCSGGDAPVAAGDGATESVPTTEAGDGTTGDATGDTVEIAAAVDVGGPDLVPYEDGVADPTVGVRAPTIRSVGPAGESVAFRPGGAPTLVVLVAHWCPFCQDEVPKLSGLIDGGMLGGAGIVFVSTAQDEGRGNWPPSTWLAGEGIDVPILVDDVDASIARAFGLRGFPFYVAVDRDGLVAGRSSGALEVAEIEAFVALATGRST